MHHLGKSGEALLAGPKPRKNNATGKVAGSGMLYRIT
jgi:hypothetical protein